MEFIQKICIKKYMPLNLYKLVYARNYFPNILLYEVWSHLTILILVYKH